MGDADDSFEAFVRGRSVALLRTANVLTADRGEAEDLLQEVLGRMHRKWRSIDAPDAYARRALVHQATSRGRWRSRRPAERELTVADDRGGGPEDPATASAERDAMSRALRQLPPRQRAVVALRYLDDLSVNDTATVLGCSAGAVKTHTMRGLARLRELLEPNGDSLEITR